MVASGIPRASTETHGPPLDPVAKTQDKLLCTFARLLATYGTPAHRVETALSALAQRWGIRGAFFAVPTGVFAEIERDQWSSTRLIKVQPTDVRLDLLVKIDDVLERTLAGDLDENEALERLEALSRAPMTYGPTQIVAGFALMGAAAARFFSGGVWDLVLALVLAGSVGVVAVTAGRSGRVARVSEFLAGVVAAGMAVVGASALSHAGWGSADANVLTLAALIILLPGLTITVAVSELATRNLVAGSARLFSAATTLLMLGFGAAIGARTGAALVLWFAWAPNADPATGLPEWTLAPALLVAAVGLVVVFHARWRDVTLFAIIGAAAFWSARLGSLVVDVELAVFLAALVIGVTANLYARVRRRPTALVTVPGIILLVPGSVGFRSVSSFMAADAVSGVQTAFQVVFVAVAIVMGLLLANAAMPPRRVL